MSMSNKDTDRPIGGMTVEHIRFVANDLGWSFYSYDPEQKKVRLVRDETRMDLWLTKRSTVAIMQKGKPAIYHRFVCEKQLDSLLDKS